MIKKNSFRVLIAYPNLSMMLTPSYAVGLFTSILKNEGYCVDLFDCTPYAASNELEGDAPLAETRANSLGNSRRFDPISLFGEAKKDVVSDFVKKLENYQPHTVIFSTIVEDTWPQVKQMLEVLSHYPQTKSLIGGVFTTMAPELVIADPHVQCIGCGEGEELIVEFCERVRQEGSTMNLKGSWAKDSEGKIIRNPPRPLVNINNVIPDFSLFDERRFFRPLGAKIWKTIPLETYRGCPYTCTFCNSPAQVIIAKENNQGLFTRRKSIDTLRQEIEIMIDRYQPEFFYINDDAFMARPKREIKAFSEMYKDFKIPFWFQTRFEDIDAEKLAWLAEVGCFRISFGLEHGNEKYRKEKLHRNITNEAMLRQAQIVTNQGIPFTLNNIIGFPYETRELLFESIEFNREIGSFDAVSVNIFVPYRGTQLRQMAIKEGWLDPNRQTTSVIARSILDMPEPYLSANEIYSLQRVFAMYTKFPKSRWPEIKIAEQLDEEGDTMFEKLSVEYYQEVWGQSEEERLLTYVG